MWCLKECSWIIHIVAQEFQWLEISYSKSMFQGSSFVSLLKSIGLCKTWQILHSRGGESKSLEGRRGKLKLYRNVHRWNFGHLFYIYHIQYRKNNTLSNIKFYILNNNKPRQWPSCFCLQAANMMCFSRV